MAKYLFYFLSIVISTSIYSQVDPNMVDIPHQVFVNGGTDDFDQILYKDETIAEKVKSLHTYIELGHDFPAQMHTFDEYWERYKEQWFYIQFKENKSPMLLFHGLRNSDDEREYVEIYNMDKTINNRMVFSEIGRLLAYKKHPFTDELILFVHRYPCCKSASHNIFNIRQINENLKFHDRFFVGRDTGDMVGPFFPERVNHDGKYHFLTKKTELRWSPAVVSENAFEGWTESNLMIHYDKGAMYKILHDQGEWLFVLFFTGIAEEQSKMLNYTNFKNKGVYGWIKK